MRAGSTLLSHPKFKAVRAAVAAGSLAGLAVLGACSDNPVASNVGRPGIPDAPRLGIVGGTAHVVQVCVDLSSDPSPAVDGKYSFTGAAMPTGVPPYPWFELKTSDDDEAYLLTLGITENSDGPFNAVTDNDVITTNISLARGECAPVFQRANTCPAGADCSIAGNNNGNRLWTDANGTTNPFAGATITAAATPAGYSRSLACVNDDPGNPISCVDGGYGVANVFHGSTFTFTYNGTPATGQIAPTQTTCEDYAKHTSSSLAAVLDGFKGLKIHNAAPGVFFYYASVTKGAGEAVAITQSISPNAGTLPKYVVQQTQAYLYSFNGSSCTRVATLPLTNNGTTASGGASLPAGTYVLGVKYATDAPVGTVVPNASLTASGALLSTHNFQVTVNAVPVAASSASINTKAK